MPLFKFTQTTTVLITADHHADAVEMFNTRRRRLIASGEARQVVGQWEYPPVEFDHTQPTPRSPEE